MFWIALIIYIVGTATSYNFLWKAIQYGEMFGWWRTHVIDYFFGKGYRKLADFLGDCQICFAHFIGWLNFIPFFVIGYRCIHWHTGWWLFWQILLAVWVGLVIITIGWWVSLFSKSILDKNFEAIRKLKDHNDKKEQAEQLKKQSS